jgi:benzylsuccinate CoA-transferase BbsF subunit
METPKALQGLKILGFVTAGVGPMLVKVLATHGATCIIVESEKRFNVARSGGPFKNNKPGVNNSYFFATHNSDKLSMSIDLKHPRAKEVTDKLIPWADVIIDNWRGGVMESWGLGYEDIKKINPECIVISCTHEGRTGPHGQTAGFGAPLSALSGLMSLTGWPDRPPIPLGALGILPDFIAPRFANAAILAALDYRRRTGKGQHIDLSEYEGTIQFQIPAILEYTANNRIMRRDGNKSLHAAPHAVYRCKGNDRWVAIEVYTEDEWKIFCEIIGNPEWTRNSKFKTLRDRKMNEDELNKNVETWTINYTGEEIMNLMQSSQIKAGPVRNMEDVVEHCPQLAHRKYWWRLQHPEIGETLHAGSSYLLSKTPYKLEKSAPCIGEHNEYICTKLLNIPDEQFISLLQEDVFK